ncbi:MAG: oxaloacetate decarboxylase [Bacteroidaceae bacterium]|nr:oxaloacetate decarboxylase [Bacteroidaceae bacterium]
MENLMLGVKLLIVGMVTVCLILYLVILLGKGLIAFANMFPEKKEEPKQRVSAPVVSESTKSVLEAAVKQITGGKGRITNITKV